MKTKIILRRIDLCAVVLLILFNLTSSGGLRGNTGGEFRSVDPNQTPNVLTLISDHVLSNYKGIRTWEGEVDVTIERVFEGPAAERIFKTETEGADKIPSSIKRHKENKIEFALDSDKGLLYASNYRQKPSQYTDLESGRDLVSKSVPNFIRSIVTPEYHIQCSPYTMREGIILSSKAVKESREECTECETPLFDPRTILKVSTPPIWEILSHLAERIANDECAIDGYTLRVEKRTDGVITEYRIQKPSKLSPKPERLGPEYYMIFTMTFSSAKGFNIISEEITWGDGKLFKKLTWNYKLVDGIYLPHKTTEQVFRGDTGRLSHEQKSTFNNLQINHLIPENTFTYKNLGMKNGDKFIDKIGGKEYIYQEEKLIEVEKKNK